MSLSRLATIVTLQCAHPGCEQSLLASVGDGVTHPGASTLCSLQVPAFMLGSGVICFYSMDEYFPFTLYSPKGEFHTSLVERALLLFRVSRLQALFDYLGVRDFCSL